MLPPLHAQVCSACVRRPVYRVMQGVIEHPRGGVSLDVGHQIHSKSNQPLPIPLPPSNALRPIAAAAQVVGDHPNMQPPPPPPPTVMY